jgi:hypothetical protein
MQESPTCVLSWVRFSQKAVFGTFYEDGMLQSLSNKISQKTYYLPRMLIAATCYAIFSKAFLHIFFFFQT